MHRNIKFLFFGFFFVFLVTSCAKKLTEGNEKLPRVKEKLLVEKLDSLASFKPDFFYGKMSTKYQDTLRKVSFKTSLRMKMDSAVSAIITYARIPVVNALVTKDTIIVTNKKDKCFIKEDLQFLKESFGVDFKHENIEEMFLGMPLDYNDSNKYFQIHDPFNYVISSHRKWEIRRTERGGREEEDVIIKYYLENDLSNLKRIEIESAQDSTSIVIAYSNRKLIDRYALPSNVFIEITSPKNHILIDMEYDKIELNDPRDIFIVIPEGYEKCE